MMDWNCLIIANNINKYEIIFFKKPENIYAIDLISWDEVKSYNLEDYDIIFLDIEISHNFDRMGFDCMLPLLRFQLTQIIVIFASKCTIQIQKPYDIDYMEYSDLIHIFWMDIPLSESKDGKKIIQIKPEDKLSRLFFKDFNDTFKWRWSIKKEDLPDGSYTLAKNKIGDIISTIFKKGNKTLILLPHPDYKFGFIRTFLENIEEIEKELFYKIHTSILKKPDWIKEFDCFNKRKLINEKREIERQINKIELYESLLYGYGNVLEYAISEIFRNLGFQSVTQTSDKADLTCETPNVKIIAEIKGLKNFAKEKNIAQMYKWLVEGMDNVEEHEKEIRQIFICNAYRDLKIKERGDYFHEKVIEVAITHKWGLLSTLELYYALLKIHKNELDMNQFINKIENQIGLIKFD